VKFLTPFTGKNDYVIAQVAYGEGATNYIGSNFGAGGLGAMLLQSGFPVVTNTALAPVFDGVVVGAGGAAGTGIDLTTGWSVTAGFEHWWVPTWKTSLYGAYGQLEYGQNASAFLAGVAGADADWKLWQVGSRTVWTPVPNLDLSVEILYTKLEGAFGGLAAAGFGTFGDKDYVSGIIRAQRNFYP
jgi:hypothetical protein